MRKIPILAKKTRLFKLIVLILIIILLAFVTILAVSGGPVRYTEVEFGAGSDIGPDFFVVEKTMKTKEVAQFLVPDMLFNDGDTIYTVKLGNSFDCSSNSTVYDRINVIIYDEDGLDMNEDYLVENVPFFTISEMGVIIKDIKADAEGNGTCTVKLWY